MYKESGCTVFVKSDMDSGDAFSMETKDATVMLMLVVPGNESFGAKSGMDVFIVGLGNPLVNPLLVFFSVKMVEETVVGPNADALTIGMVVGLIRAWEVGFDGSICPKILFNSPTISSVLFAMILARLPSSMQFVLR